MTTQIELLLATQDIVRRLGTAAISISHDLPAVAQVVGRVKVPLQGEEVEEAPT